MQWNDYGTSALVIKMQTFLNDVVVGSVRTWGPIVSVTRIRPVPYLLLQDFSYILEVFRLGLGKAGADFNRDHLPRPGQVS
jgi:hypothetical protein